MNVHAFLDHVLGPSCSQNLIFTIDFNDFWTTCWAHFVPHRGQKIKGPFCPSTFRSASDFIKRLKNVKLSSKSGFSPQELPNWSQNTNMKWLKNVKLSSKSRFSPQEPPNLSQDTNMKLIKNVKLSFKSSFSHQELSNSSQDTNIKQLKNVKQWSKPAFTTQELQYNSLKTWIHRSNHLLALKSFQTYQKILT